MEDCPACQYGMIEEDGRLVRCDICHGTGNITNQRALEYWTEDIEVYEAQRRYLHELTAD